MQRPRAVHRIRQPGARVQVRRGVGGRRLRDEDVPRPRLRRARRLRRRRLPVRQRLRRRRLLGEPLPQRLLGPRQLPGRGVRVRRRVGGRRLLRAAASAAAAPTSSATMARARARRCFTGLARLRPADVRAPVRPAAAARTARACATAALRVRGATRPCVPSAASRSPAMARSPRHEAWPPRGPRARAAGPAARARRLRRRWPHVHRRGGGRPRVLGPRRVHRRQVRVRPGLHRRRLLAPPVERLLGPRPLRRRRRLRVPRRLVWLRLRAALVPQLLGPRRVRERDDSVVTAARCRRSRCASASPAFAASAANPSVPGLDVGRQRRQLRQRRLRRVLGARRVRPETGKCTCAAPWSGEGCSECGCGPAGRRARQVRADRGDRARRVGSLGKFGCACEPGWGGDDCSLRECKGGCGGAGWCHDGTCLCYPGSRRSTAARAAPSPTATTSSRSCAPVREWVRGALRAAAVGPCGRARARGVRGRVLAKVLARVRRGQ